jgi:hypothetical protein
LRDLPNLKGRLVDPSDPAAVRAALGQVSALAGEYRARVGSGERALVIVFELTELDQPTLAVLARLGQLGADAGVQLVAASAQPWPLVVDHCPLGLFAAFTSRLAFGGEEEAGLVVVGRRRRLAVR